MKYLRLTVAIGVGTLEYLLGNAERESMSECFNKSESTMSQKVYVRPFGVNYEKRIPICVGDSHV